MSFTWYKPEAVKATILCSKSSCGDLLAQRAVERTTRSSLQEAMLSRQPSAWAGLKPSLLAWERGNDECDHPLL